MPRMVLLTNHELTNAQIEEAKQRYQIERFIKPPLDIQKIWKAVPADKDTLHNEAEVIISWLQHTTTQGDFLLVHGDFGMVFMLVEWALRNNRVAVYSTTERRYTQSTDEQGNMINIHVFKHVRFREYMRTQY
ncbi:MAG: CRISPR-associated protein Csx20 [Spirochaetota bacterium]